MNLPVSQCAESQEVTLHTKDKKTNPRGKTLGVMLTVAYIVMLHKGIFYEIHPWTQTFQLAFS